MNTERIAHSNNPSSYCLLYFLLVAICSLCAYGLVHKYDVDKMPYDPPQPLEPEGAQGFFPVRSRVCTPYENRIKISLKTFFLRMHREEEKNRENPVNLLEKKS